MAKSGGTVYALGTEVIMSNGSDKVVSAAPYQCDQTVKCKVARNYLKFAQNVTIAVLTRKWMYSNEAEKSEHTFWVLL